ncbi:porin [Siculibacillus lacustris]|nr:porin [Siculibacillus lacustris]
MNFKLAILAAAAIGAATTAQAADLAKKAPAAANYVKVCDTFGAGFFYIPGSDTCLKISGLVRAEYYVGGKSEAWNGGSWSGKSNGQAGGATGNYRQNNGIGTFARGEIDIDARTSTEFGLLRSFIALQADLASGKNTVATLDKGFIQFGGLTAGHAQSFFDFWTGYSIGNYETAHSDTSTNLLAYTFSFGNGISATLSIEDPTTGGRRVTGTGFSYYTNVTPFNIVSPTTAASVAYGGARAPDFIANLAVDQAWGKAQVSAALHEDYGSVSGDKYGYAFLGGVQINLPALGAGDKLALQAAYAKGAVAYVFAGNDGGAYDFSVVNASLKQSDAWSITGALTHNWTKKLSSTIELGYASFNSGLSTAGFGGSKVDDFSQLDVQGNLAWTPVTGLTVIGEVEYRKIDYSWSGAKDKDAVLGILRVQRDF